VTFHNLAARYADDPHEVDHIAALAAERLAARLRRSGVACVVCGKRFVADRADAETCSAVCRKKRSRQA
jgi:hypothetical protein